VGSPALLTPFLERGTTMKRRKRAHAPDFYRKMAFVWDDQAWPNAFTFKVGIDNMTLDCMGSLLQNMKEISFSRVALFTYASMSGREILKLPPLWQLGLIAMHTVSYCSIKTTFVIGVDEIDDFFPKKAGDQIRARILAKELEG
jgi:hypothetical protein